MPSQFRHPLKRILGTYPCEARRRETLFASCWGGLSAYWTLGQAGLKPKEAVSDKLSEVGVDLANSGSILTACRVFSVDNLRVNVSRAVAGRASSVGTVRSFVCRAG